jgi:periplasmic protein TonB
MGAAIADARFGSDDRLLIGCVVGSLLLHALVVLYVPRVLPHGEPLRPMTATIREVAPPPVLPKGEPPPAIAPKPEVVRQREIAPPAKPVERKSDPLTPAKSETPVRQEILTAPPQAAAAAERAPSVPAPAQTPAVAAPAPAPAPAVPVARPEPRREVEAPKPASTAEAPGVPDGSIACQYRNTLLTLIGTRRLLRYPQEARDNGWVGNTVVIVMIGVDGKIAGIKTATSSGYDVLDEQARIAASRAKQIATFPPQLLGKAFELRLSLGFNLDENTGADPIRLRLQAC